MSRRLSFVAVVAFIVALLALTSCNRGKLINKEYAFVAAPQVNVRDRLAAVYNKVAVLSNGDRVEILERQKRFVKIRLNNGQEGWLEQRYLVGQEIFDGFENLKKQHETALLIGRGVTRAELNIHLEPARDSEHLFQLKDGEKVEVLERAVTEKQTVKAGVAKPKPAVQPVSQKTTTAGKDATPAQPAQSPPAVTADKKSADAKAVPDAPKVFEDWWLVRNADKRTGWVLARMIDLDVPLEIAQYAEGQRIMGYHILNTVNDEGKDVPQYLVLTNEPKDGLAWDYNHIRVFTWNVKRHRYETAYRERGLWGVYPVRTGTENFDKEGTLPFFVLRLKDDNGNFFEKKYKLNGPIVRRVLSPEEQAKVDAERDKAIAERKARIEALRAERKARRAAAKPTATKHAHAGRRKR